MVPTAILALAVCSRERWIIVSQKMYFVNLATKVNKSSSYSTEVAAKMLVTLLDEKISYLTYLTKRNIEVTKTERS